MGFEIFQDQVKECVIFFRSVSPYITPPGLFDILHNVKIGNDILLEESLNHSFLLWDLNHPNKFDISSCC